jgi:hypothetical protein
MGNKIVGLVVWSSVVCVGCMATSAPPAAGPPPPSPSVAYSVSSPCLATDEELGELLEYEYTVRVQYQATPAEAERRARARRLELDKVVETRCAADEAQRREEEDFQDRFYRSRREAAWRAVSPPAPPPPPPPPPVADTKGPFWCRASGECFHDSEACRLSDGTLYECANRDLVACADHTAELPSVACFASSDACLSFCSRRAEPFGRRFACLSECTVYDASTGVEREEWSAAADGIIATIKRSLGE